MTTSTVGKWGNAAAVRLPQAFCEQAGISIGDAVQIVLDGDSKIVIEALPNPHTLKGRMEAWDGVRYKTSEFDWGEPQGQEIW